MSDGELLDTCNAVFAELIRRYAIRADRAKVSVPGNDRIEIHIGGLTLGITPGEARRLLADLSTVIEPGHG